MVVEGSSAVPGPERKLETYQLHSGMQIATMLTGYAGSIPDRLSPNLIGPYDVRGATVRSLLCRFVKDARGGMWSIPPIAEALPDSVNLDLLWTVVPYQNGP